MRIKFRQGMVRHQTDITNTPTFLQQTATGVTLNVSPDPTLITFAHGQNSDYLIEERTTVVNAWSGPFVAGTDYWLYWDVDVITGARTFGHTLIDPVSESTAPAIIEDQHWFDTQKGVMFVRQGVRWVEKIRVFACKLSNGVVLIPFNTGTQVGIDVETQAGFLIFDDEDNAVKKFKRSGRGKFITTVSRLAAQVSKLASIVLEAGLTEARAVVPIPELHCVSMVGPNEIALASYMTPEFPAIGIVVEDMFPGEVRTVFTSGRISSETWNWTQPPGTKLFVGLTGELTTTVPQTRSIHNVATIVNTRAIFLNIQHLVILDEA